MEITRLTPSPIASEEELVFVSEMADKAILHLRQLQAEETARHIDIVAAQKNASLWENERWYMTQSIKRWNRA